MLPAIYAVHLTDYLHLARRTTPCEKLRGPGQGKPLPDIAAAQKRAVEPGGKEQTGVVG